MCETSAQCRKKIESRELCLGLRSPQFWEAHACVQRAGDHAASWLSVTRRHL